MCSWCEWLNYVCSEQIRIWARKKAIEDGHGDYALNITGPILKFFENYYNVPYPLSKSGVFMLSILSLECYLYFWLRGNILSFLSFSLLKTRLPYPIFTLGQWRIGAWWCTENLTFYMIQPSHLMQTKRERPPLLPMNWLTWYSYLQKHVQFILPMMCNITISCFLCVHWLVVWQPCDSKVVEWGLVEWRFCILCVVSWCRLCWTILECGECSQINATCAKGQLRTFTSFKT